VTDLATLGQITLAGTLRIGRKVHGRGGPLWRRSKPDPRRRGGYGGRRFAWCLSTDRAHHEVFGLAFALDRAAVRPPDPRRTFLPRVDSENPAGFEPFGATDGGCRARAIGRAVGGNRAALASANNRKRPADRAFLVRFAREMVCPLTGELRGTHDDGYRTGWS
jgi:hypothetical protein